MRYIPEEEYQFHYLRCEVCGEPGPRVLNKPVHYFCGVECSEEYFEVLKNELSIDSAEEVKA